MKLCKTYLDNGRFFSVTFRKKDGSLRKMIARRGVKRNLQGNPRYNPADYNLLVVWSINDEAYRSINLNTVLEVKAAGLTFSGLY
jgi:hypothetical protein